MKRTVAVLALMSAISVFGDDAVVSSAETNAMPAAAVAETNATPRESHAIVRLLNSRVAGSPRGYEAAAKSVIEAADAGKPLQQFIVAVLSDDNDAPECLRVGARKRQYFLETSRERIFRLAEERSNPLAWYLLALERFDAARRMRREGLVDADKVRRAEDDGYVYLERAADGGNVQALNAWGMVLVNRAFADPTMSTNEVVRTLERGFKAFKRASDKDDENGMYNVGLCYLNGYGVERNLNMAYDCMCHAADHGHPEAINNVGGFYRDGVVVRPDVRRSAEWFKRSSDLGNSYGQLNYALALQRGEGVARDEKLAAELLAKSARQGNVEAMCAYGMCFRNGSGVEKDFAVAFRWFERSAKGGFSMAMKNLSECYDRGEGVREDKRKAVEWAVRARAVDGDANAAAWLNENGYPLR